MRSAAIANSQTVYSGNINATRADAAAASVLSAHQQLGAIALPTNPTNGQTLTLTVNGTAIVINFVSTLGSTPNNVKIQGTAALTMVAAYNFVTNPCLTTANQVAATAANQTLLSYLCFGLNGTTMTVGSMNKAFYSPLTSLSCSTTVTSGTYTASTMKLYVEPGVVYVNGTEVYFPGGSTPSVTAPVSNPRIDVLTLDNTGTLAWTTGTENASPTVPTYPANQMPICELYNLVGETTLTDTDNQVAGQGYILNDVRPFLDDPVNFASIPDSLLPTTDGMYDLGSSGRQWNNVYAKSGIFLNGVSINSQITTALTAAEAISGAGLPLAAGYYQSDGGVRLDTSKSGGHATGTSSISDSITVASNANRIVIVVIASTQTISAVTIGGVSATQIDSTSGGTSTIRMGVWYVLNPTAGSVAVAATLGGSAPANWAIYSYYNVAQTSTISAHNITVDTNFTNETASITPGEIGDLVFGYIGSTGNSGSGSFSLTTLPNNQQTPSAQLASGYFGTGDNGQVVSTVQQSILFTKSGSIGNPGVIYGTFALKPATAATLGAAALASSAGSYTPPTSTNFRSIAFIGFSAASASAGASVTVITAGVVSGLSGLIQMAADHLADTPGTISTTPGTITRKVGIAVDTTHLLVTNIW